MGMKLKKGGREGGRREGEGERETQRQWFVVKDSCAAIVPTLEYTHMSCSVIGL